MQFSQNHKNTVMPFAGLKTKYTWIKFLAKAKKTYPEGMFVHFLKNSALSVFDSSDPLMEFRAEDPRKLSYTALWQAQNSLCKLERQAPNITENISIPQARLFITGH